MKRLAQLAGGRLKRLLGADKDLKDLAAQFCAAFVRCDWREARRLSDRLQAIDPRPPPTAEQLKALRNKIQRLPHSEKKP
jgi:hypothetical protein